MKNNIEQNRFIQFISYLYNSPRKLFIYYKQNELDRQILSQVKGHMDSIKTSISYQQFANSSSIYSEDYYICTKEYLDNLQQQIQGLQKKLEDYNFLDKNKKQLFLLKEELKGLEQLTTQKRVNANTMATTKNSENEQVTIKKIYDQMHTLAEENARLSEENARYRNNLPQESEKIAEKNQENKALANSLNKTIDENKLIHLQLVETYKEIDNLKKDKRLVDENYDNVCRELKEVQEICTKIETERSQLQLDIRKIRGEDEQRIETENNIRRLMDELKVADSFSKTQNKVIEDLKKLIHDRDILIADYLTRVAYKEEYTRIDDIRALKLEMEVINYAKQNKENRDISVKLTESYKVIANQKGIIEKLEKCILTKNPPVNLYDKKINNENEKYHKDLILVMQKNDKNLKELVLISNDFERYENDLRQYQINSLDRKFKILRKEFIRDTVKYNGKFSEKQEYQLLQSEIVQERNEHKDVLEKIEKITLEKHEKFIKLKNTIDQLTKSNNELSVIMENYKGFFLSQETMTAESSNKLSMKEQARLEFIRTRIHTLPVSNVSLSFTEQSKALHTTTQGNSVNLDDNVS